MVEDKREIERRLQALIDSSNSPPSCSSTTFKVVAIISMVVLLGVLVGGAVIYLKWNTANSDLKNTRDNNKNGRSNLEKAKEDLKTLQLEYKNLEAILNEQKDSHKKLTDNIEDLKKKISALEVDIADTKKMLEDATKERDQLKQVHDGLKAENDKLTKDFIRLTYELEELNHTLKSNTTRLDEWKIGSGIALLVGAIGSLEDIFTHATAWRIQNELKTAEVQKLAFGNLSNGAGNYELMKRLSQSTVSRTVCFHNAPKANLTNCKGLRPTITTIITTTGYRFAYLLNVEWPTTNGDHADDTATAISDNHGAIAKLKDIRSAIILNDNYMLEFGTTGIKIANDGKSGTAQGDSFIIPSGFDKDHFFHNGTQFNITDIKIERIST